MTLRKLAPLVLGITALYVAAMLVATGGRLVLPLDDPYIYFRYAEMVAEGYPGSYNPGDAVTTGATSPLYLAVLSIGALLQLRGAGMVLFALGLGAVFLMLLARQGARLETLLTPARDAQPEAAGDGFMAKLPLSAMLLLTHGVIVWGALSGMEIALFSVLLLSHLVALHRAQEAPDARGALPWLATSALLCLARPEGALVVLAANGVAVLADVLRRRGRPRLWGPALGALLIPVGTYALLALIYWAATGHPQTSGMMAKSTLQGPDATLSSAGGEALHFFLRFLHRTLFGGGDFALVKLRAYNGSTDAAMLAPFFGLALVLAVGTWLRRISAVPSVTGLATLATSVVGIAATGLIAEPEAHFGRYQLPFVVPLVVIGAVGLRAAWQGTSGVLRSLTAGLIALCLAWHGGTLFLFAHYYGESAQDIADMHVPMARYLRERTPPDAVIGINDAGLLAIEAQRRTVDLVGLTHEAFPKAWQHGPGSVLDALQALPASTRPDYLCVFPNWYEFTNQSWLRRVHAVRNNDVIITDAEMVLYQLGWDRLLAPAALHSINPEAIEGWQQVDRLDVGELGSEAEHGVSREQPARIRGHRTLALEAPATDDATQVLAEGGRGIFGRYRFQTKVHGAKDWMLVARTPTNARQSFTVTVAGQRQQHDLPSLGRRGWRETIVARIPGRDLPVGGQLTVELEASNQETGDQPLVLFHLWCLQN